MASELSLTVSATFTKSPLVALTMNPGQLSVTVSGDNYVRNVQSVGTTVEALLLGDVATPGYVLMHNCDTTNYIDVRANNTDVPVVKLKAGEYALFRLAATAPFVKADTGACKLEYFLIPD